MAARSDPHERRSEEARRDLARLGEQSEKILGGEAFTPEARDPVEAWGRRIGRGLGFLAAALLAWHLVTTYFLGR